MLRFSPEEVMASYITRCQALFGSLCAIAVCLVPSIPFAADVVLDFEWSASGYVEAKKLRRFAAEAENFALGHQYAFRHAPSKGHIELWDIGPREEPVSSWPPNARRVD
jgi:hypothetical protein